MHFVKVQAHQSDRIQGYQFAPDEIKQKYDFVITTDRFSGSKIDFENGHELAPGYQILYDHVLKLDKDKKIITIGGDGSVSAATVAANNERYMVQQGEYCNSRLKIIWFDSSPDIETFVTSVTKNLPEMPVASLMGMTDPTFVYSKLLIKPSQIMYLGLSDELDLSLLNDVGIEYYTCNKIKQLGNEVMMEIINEFIDDAPVHIVLDMKVFDKSICTSVIPINNNGLLDKHVLPLLFGLKDRVSAMDLVEFNPCVGNPIDVRNTRELAKRCLSEALSIEKSSINIYNEHTRFLIYRPTIQDGLEDYGWYILTGIPTDFKEEIMKSIDNDTITTIDIDDEEYLVTTTTMNEQNNKSYYKTVNVLDTVLFPNEKISMMFELVNPAFVNLIGTDDGNMDRLN
jgi:arginase family enzyme